MKIFGLGIIELLVILAVTLFIFGPVALPKFGEMAGDSIRKLRKRADVSLEDGAEVEVDGDEPSCS